MSFLNWPRQLCILNSICFYWHKICISQPLHHCLLPHVVCLKPCTPWMRFIPGTGASSGQEASALLLRHRACRLASQILDYNPWACVALPVSNRANYWRLWRTKWYTLPLFVPRLKNKIFLTYLFKLKIFVDKQQIFWWD